MHLLKTNYSCAVYDALVNTLLRPSIALRGSGEIHLK